MSETTEGSSQDYMIIQEDRKFLDWIIMVLAIGMALWHLDLALFGGYENTLQRATTYLFGMTLVFLVFRDRDEKGWLFAWSMFLVILVAAALSYPLFMLDYFIQRLPLVDDITIYDYFFGTVALLVTWEAA